MPLEWPSESDALGLFFPTFLLVQRLAFSAIKSMANAVTRPPIDIVFFKNRKPPLAQLLPMEAGKWEKSGEFVHVPSVICSSRWQSNPTDMSESLPATNCRCPGSCCPPKVGAPFPRLIALWAFERGSVGGS